MTARDKHFHSDVERGISLHLRWVRGGPLFTKSAIPPLIVHDLISTWNALQSWASEDRSFLPLHPFLFLLLF